MGFRGTAWDRPSQHASQGTSSGCDKTLEEVGSEDGEAHSHSDYSFSFLATFSFKSSQVGKKYQVVLSLSKNKIYYFGVTLFSALQPFLRTAILA